ncbi:hypothetical protein MLD38_017707 [Melastoma candidum]|uniref:Uncharacterized protein n=1 Tax=Melastoma candidum TaxID=119954 RepID=A0ACB9QQN5_9MYRT|nr:hypothetical protein MLD38_017707 [Melastoma candidum]
MLRIEREKRLKLFSCFDIFTPEERKILEKYREDNFAQKRLVPSERRAIRKCPLTPEEVGLLLRAMGFDNGTRIYLAADVIGGPHTRVSPESFYTNSWPECFCQTSSTEPAHKCLPENVMELFDSQLVKEAGNDFKSSIETNSTTVER